MTERGLRLKILIIFLNFSFNLTETFGTFEGIICVHIEVLIRAHRVFCQLYYFQALYHQFSSIFPNNHFASSDHMPIWKSTVHNSIFALVDLNVPFKPFIMLPQYHGTDTDIDSPQTSEPVDLLVSYKLVLSQLFTDIMVP